METRKNRDRNRNSSNRRNCQAAGFYAVAGTAGMLPDRGTIYRGNSAQQHLQCHSQCAGIRMVALHRKAGRRM